MILKNKENSTHMGDGTVAPSTNLSKCKPRVYYGLKYPVSRKVSLVIPLSLLQTTSALWLSFHLQSFLTVINGTGIWSLPVKGLMQRLLKSYGKDIWHNKIAKYSFSINSGTNIHHHYFLDYEYLSFSNTQFWIS